MNFYKSIRYQTKRTQRVRVFILQKETGRPIGGVPVKVVAELIDEKTNTTRKIPIAILQSDKQGYLSFDLGEIAHDTELRHVWLYPYNSTELSEDAFSVINSQVDPALVTINIATDQVKKDFKGPNYPSVQDADATDFQVSPESVTNRETLVLGQDGCEEIIPNRDVERSFRFVQIVTSSEEPASLQSLQLDSPGLTTCEKGVIQKTNNVEFENIPEYCFRRGAMFEYEITWTPVGHGLGRLIYSLPLAPCESVKIAVIDWKREDTLLREEETSLAEQLKHNLLREREIEETVQSSLREMQRGSSFMGGVGIAASASIKVVNLGGTLGMGGGITKSSGSRRLVADTVQNVSDSISQNSGAFRRLNSTIIVQASQAEEEFLQTRIVANHNHCHALTILYYEVVRRYLVRVRFIKKQDVLLLKYYHINDLLQEPFKGGDTFPYNTEFNFRTALRYRQVLKSVLLDPALGHCFNALDKYYCAIANFNRIPPAFPPPDYPLGIIMARFRTGARHLESDILKGITVSLKTEYGANEVYLIKEGDYVWRPGIMLSVPLRELGGHKRIDGEISTTRAFSSSGQEDIFFLRPEVPIRWGNVKYIKISVDDDLNDWDLAHFQMRTEYEGEVWTMFDRDVNIGFRQTAGEDSSAEFETNDIAPATPENTLTEPEYCCLQGLIEHLNFNKSYYMRAIWLDQDPEERARAFERFNISFTHKYKENNEEKEELLNGRLCDFIENRIVGVKGDYVAFPCNFTSFANELDQEGELETTQYLALPTRGVFAESKLSHCNSCEERDITRFWDWQKSPCPEPPEIAPVSAGGHESEPLKETPTAFPSSLVNIVTPPSAPDPTGLSSALNLLGTAEIFRDMSAKSEVSALVQKLAEGAVAMARGQGGTGAESPESMHDRRMVAERAIEGAVRDGAISEEEGNVARRQIINDLVRSTEGRSSSTFGSGGTSEPGSGASEGVGTSRPGGGGDVSGSPGETPGGEEVNRIRFILHSIDSSGRTLPGRFQFKAYRGSELIDWEYHMRIQEGESAEALVAIPPGVHNVYVKSIYEVDREVRNRDIPITLPFTGQVINVPAQRFIREEYVCADTPQQHMVIAPETETVVLNLVANLAETEVNSEITIGAGIEVETAGSMQITDEINASIEALGRVFGITRLIGLTVIPEASASGTFSVTTAIQYIDGYDFNIGVL